MGRHSLGEVLGFWIMMSGLIGILLTVILLSLSRQSAEKVMDWAERRLRIHPLVQILLPIVSILSAFVGMHMMCVSGGGVYPGYPLDIIFEWFKG